MTEKLLSLAIIGVEPILYLLILISVVSLGVIVERFWAYSEIESNGTTYNDIEIQLLLDQRLGILATFGNNAPFIGLFGTVLGVIDAFHRLGSAGDFAVNAVMGGISEALVATAMGLFVAIPCVIAYNYFLRRMRRIMLRREAQWQK
jgi:biopolymer transport protein ExbB